MTRFALLALFLTCAHAQAQSIQLNPGDVNNLGVALSCVPAGETPPPPAPPPPPPAPVPVLVGQFRQSPDMDCISRAPKADPKTIDQFISSCGTRSDNRMSCDSTSVAGSNEDGRCFSMLYAKETSPTVIHPDQMQRLHSVCVETTYNCYVNR